ncbi:TPA: hypothetical protein MYP38_004862 [Citrobacter braakii]|jgi:hypothetical protein|nr:hypothetical protein [Citrobacter braakii]
MRLQGLSASHNFYYGKKSKPDKALQLAKHKKGRQNKSVFFDEGAGMGITIEKVEAIAAKLRAMPPIENKKREVSKQESIKLLTGEITALRERGYTLEQIAALLTEDELQIGAPTLKSYLQRAASTGRHGSKQRSTKRKAASTATSPSSTPAAQAATSTAQGQPPALTIGERAAASISETPGSKTSATAAITRPDRERI